MRWHKHARDQANDNWFKLADGCTQHLEETRAEMAWALGGNFKAGRGFCEVAPVIGNGWDSLTVERRWLIQIRSLHLSRRL